MNLAEARRRRDPPGRGVHRLAPRASPRGPKCPDPRHRRPRAPPARYRDETSPSASPTRARRSPPRHAVVVVRSKGRASAARAKARDGAPAAPRAAPRAAARGSWVALCLAPFLSYTNSACDTVSQRWWLARRRRRRCLGPRARAVGWRSVATPVQPRCNRPCSVRPSILELNSHINSIKSNP